MKCGLSMYSLLAPVRAGQLDLLGFLDYAAQTGFEGVELLDMFWTDEVGQVPEVKGRCAALGLKLPVYSISTNFFRPDAMARDAELAALKHGVGVASQLGAPLLRVFSGDLLPGYSFEQGFAWVVDCLAAGAEFASQSGITLVLENHGQIAGRSDQVRAIIEAVGSPALRSNLDTGNFLLVGEDPLQAARSLADLVALVHLKDFTRAGPDEGDSHTGTWTAICTRAPSSARVLLICRQSMRSWRNRAIKAGCHWSTRAISSPCRTPCRAARRRCGRCFSRE